MDDRRVDILAREQDAWFARPSEERKQFQDEFLAITGGEVVDHDPDQRALYLRVYQKFGNLPVLMLHSDWDEPPTYTIHSPRLEK